MTFVFRGHNGHEPFPFVCGWCGHDYLSARDLVEHVQRERAAAGAAAEITRLTEGWDEPAVTA